MTHKLQTKIEDFPEETIPEGKEFSGNSSQIQIFFESHPELQKPTLKHIQVSIMDKFLNKQSPQEHQIDLMSYIAKAREQTKTPQFLFETRVVEYAEKFYSKFCQVELSHDQLNDIRLNWKEYNEQFPNDTLEKMREDKLINIDFDKLPENKEIAICGDCNTGFWTRVEHQFDFYILEEMNGGMLIGTKDLKGKEYVFFIKKTLETKNCECGHCCNDLFSEKVQPKYQKASFTIIINPTKHIKDKLSEQLRGQKYLSTDNTQIAFDASRAVLRKQLLLRKGKLRHSDAELNELNLKRQKNEKTDKVEIVSNGCNFLSSHVAVWQRHIEEKFISTFWSAGSITVPLNILKPIVNVPVSFLNPLKIFSNGFGQDSITEIVLNHAHWDQIIFSDTGSEQKETYEFIEKFLAELPKVTRYKMRIVHSRYGIIYNYYNHRPNPMSPMYSMRDCTEKFKIEPIKQWIRGKYGLNPMAFRGKEIQDEFGNIMKNPDYKADVRGSKKNLYHHRIVLGLGINKGEEHRAHTENVWYLKNNFPLIEKKIVRDDESMIIKALGVDVPVKSGCFFCFFANKPYWLKLRRKHPDQYDLAVKFYADAKKGSSARQDNGGLELELVKFPTDEEFAEYMKKFPSCGDEEVELGCECMNGNMNSGMTRGRSMPDEEDALIKKPAYIGGSK